MNEPTNTSPALTATLRQLEIARIRRKLEQHGYQLAYLTAEERAILIQP